LLTPLTLRASVQLAGILSLQAVLLWRELQHRLPDDAALRHAAFITEATPVKAVLKCLVHGPVTRELGCKSEPVRDERSCSASALAWANSSWHARTTAVVVRQHAAISRAYTECSMPHAAHRETDTVQGGVVLVLSCTHPDEAAALAALKPNGRKRQRGRVNSGWTPWGGEKAMLDAALALGTDDLRHRCTLARTRCACYVKVFREPVLVGGRYLKLRRGVPQSPWLYGNNDDAAEEEKQGQEGRIGLSSVQVALSSQTCFAVLKLCPASDA
jgi:hypothetical protein